ncbi:MAG: cupin domain-containing protein [bacterium]
MNDNCNGDGDERNDDDGERERSDDDRNDGDRDDHGGILVERDPSPMKLEVLGAEQWPLRTEPVAVQMRDYARTATMLVVRGRARITPQHGPDVAIGDGDLVTFLPRTRCTWRITEALEMHCLES